MKLAKTSYLWAIENIAKFSDTDNFPRLVENEILCDNKDAVAQLLSDTDLDRIGHSESRKYIVPKDDLSYRLGTQLAYLDNVVLTAILYEFGKLIEAKRISVSRNMIFSYRFKPAPDFSMYDSINSWNKYWSAAHSKGATFSHFLVLDISDFYNQIYHHTVENALIDAGFPNQVKKWVMDLLEKNTSKVSRGVPIGTHSIHLLAEAVLANIDNSLLSRGIEYVRYVDDFILFCSSEVDARKKNLIFAEILDKQNKLVVQKQKTKILTRSEFYKEYANNVEDRPINDLEEKLVKIIRKYSQDDPYRLVLLSDIDPTDLAEFGHDVVEKIIREYIEKEPVDYIRLRWFMRRLAQVGHPSGLPFVLNNIEKLLPALNDIFKYLLNVDSIGSASWPSIGSGLLSLVESDFVASVDYYRLIIYSLFNQKSSLNHHGTLLGNFGKSAPDLRREIILLAYRTGQRDWIRELKDSFASMCRRAYLVATSILPAEERRFFINSFARKDDMAERLIADWALSV